MAAWIEGWFGIDIRSLAVFRIALGAAHLCILLWLLPDIGTFYTDDGAIPRTLAMDHLYPWQFSIHLMNGEWGSQLLIFMLHGLCALALALGYRARLMACLCWVGLASLIHRALPVIQGSEVLLLCLTFWAMFLPIGTKWGVDAALNPLRNTVPTRVLSVTSAAILLQALYVYFIGALLKDHPVWHRGDAVSAALHMEAYSLLGGHWLRQFPALCHILTYLVFCLEFFAPLLLLSRTWQVRIIGLSLLTCMHLAFSASLGIGIFPYVSLTSLILFLPSEFWNWLGSKLCTPERRNIILYYDEPCTFCKKTCELVREFLLPGDTPILPAQSKKRIHNLMVKHHSWVVQDHEGKHHLRWEALIYLLRISALFGWLGKLLSIGPLPRWGDQLYGHIGDSRGKLGRLTAIFLPYRSLSIKPWRATQAMALMLLLATLWINLATVFPKTMPLPTWLAPVTHGIHLDQNWNLFAPYPLSASGWLVAEGVLENGQTIDAWNNRLTPPSFATPPLISSWYPSFRWRKYITQIYNESAKRDYQLALESWLCRRWNRSHPPEQQLSTIQVHLMWMSSYEFNQPRTIHQTSGPVRSCMGIY
jgi:hypothetical protein